jgi:hypothetical protein
VKRFIGGPLAPRHLFSRRTGRNPILSLLIGIGALFVAVVVSAIIDQWPQSLREDLDDPSTIDATTLPI